MNRPPPELGVTAADLAPGDKRSAEFDWRGFTAESPRSIDDPTFAAAYALLWDEFGPVNELESSDVLARRFASPGPPAGRWGIRYEFVVLRHRGIIAAVADHTAVIDRDRPSPAAICVHVSHLLVLPPWRRTGLAGWVRALPVSTARRVADANAMPMAEVTLVGEAEHAVADRPATLGRLRSFGRAGFLKIDPAAVPYVQPDFRPPALIDATGGSRPVALSLVVRRVGNEIDPGITGAAVRSLVESIYAVYADGLRASEIDAVRRTLTGYPSDEMLVRLVMPSVPSPGIPGEG